MGSGISLASLETDAWLRWPARALLQASMLGGVSSPQPSTSALFLPAPAGATRGFFKRRALVLREAMVV